MSTRKSLKSEITERIRLLAGENPGRFAKSAGITDQTFRRYLTGSMPSSEKAVAIAEAGGVSVEWLLTGVDCQQAGSPVTPIEAKHINLVRRFRDKERAVRLNEQLLRIEACGTEYLARVQAFLDGLLSGAEPIDLQAPPRNKKNSA